MSRSELEQKATTIRERALNVMQTSSFLTDVPGVRYERPNLTEFPYGDESGGQLLVRLIGSHVRVSVISGRWSGLSDALDDEQDDGFRYLGILMDPRTVLTYLTDISTEQAGDTNTLKGRVAVERLPIKRKQIPEPSWGQNYWWAGMTVDELTEQFSPRARIVIDQGYRVTSMEITIADWKEEGEVHTIEKHNFFYP